MSRIGAAFTSAAKITVQLSQELKKGTFGCEIVKTMKILVHVCCAPCALFCFSRLKKEFSEVMGFWYNPNIHPYREYQKRLQSVKKWARETGMQIIYEDNYELKNFLRAVAYRESERCSICYYLRFQKTALFARRGKFDYFASTLLVSPHQNQKVIRAMAEAVGKEYTIKPYLTSFRESWRESRELSRNMGLYHQQYCGCIYSEAERYRG